MEGYTRKELVQLCKEHNKTAENNIKCNGTNKSIYDALVASGTITVRGSDLEEATGPTEETQLQGITQGRLAELEPLSHLELTDYFTKHREICDNEALWSAMFARVYPDLYELFKNIEFPDIEKSKQRKHAPWYDLYVQMLAISTIPSLLSAVESIVNDEQEPLDKWRRADLAGFERVSFALALINEFYLAQLAYDESYLVEWIPIKPELWLPLLKKTTSTVLFKRYVDVEEQLSAKQRLTLNIIINLLIRAINADKDELFSLVVAVADQMGLLWRDFRKLQKEILKSNNLRILNAYITKDNKVAVSEINLTIALEHSSLLRHLLTNPKRELERYMWDYIIRNLKDIDLETLELLLSKFDPTDQNLSSIMLHVPRIEVYELLRSYPQSANALLAGALWYGKDEELVRYILKDTRGEILDNFRLQDAIIYPLPEILTYLLSDTRLNPGKNADVLARTLIAQGTKKKAKILLADKRFTDNLTADNLELIKAKYKL